MAPRKKKVANNKLPAEKAELIKLPTAFDQCIAWMLEGNSSDDIANALRVKFPDQNPADLINKAGDHFAEVAKADPTVIRGWCLEALREMYRRLVGIGDYDGALKAVKELMAYAKRAEQTD